MTKPTVEIEYERAPERKETMYINKHVTPAVWASFQNAVMLHAGLELGEIGEILGFESLGSVRVGQIQALIDTDHGEKWVTPEEAGESARMLRITFLMDAWSPARLQVTGSRTI